MKRFLPIRKVATGLVASGLFYAAHRAGFTFGQADADQAAQGLVGFVAGYIVPDPRVQALAKRVSLWDKLRLLNDLANYSADTKARVTEAQKDRDAAALLALQAENEAKVAAQPVPPTTQGAPA